jgi:4-oxalocrotonate tautomerase
MPEIYIYLAEGRAPEKKKALMKDITDAVVKNFEVNPEAVVVQIVEAKKTDKMKGGLLFSERTPSKPAGKA